MRDCGFDFPDTRQIFFTKSEGKVEICIVRHWYQAEDDESDFKVSFNIKHTDSNGIMNWTELPIGTDESKASTIAHTLYEEDEEATNEWNDTEAMCAAEQRMGA